MGKKILNFFKLSKIFYIGIIPIIYLSINTGIYQAHDNPIEKYVIENHSGVRKLIPNFQIGIVHGIIIFFVLTILWIFLIKVVSNFNKDKAFAKKFFVLGEMSVDNVIMKLFYIGFIIVAFWAYIFRMYCSSIVFRFISYDTYYSQLFALIASYIVTFAVILVLWKIVCELLIIIFRCFEVYYKSKKKDLKE